MQNTMGGLRGFTLVELSIVLVVIGLLVGGVLAAQSMIETARINSFVKQIQQIDVSLSNFRQKYNYLPGDAPGMPNGGDGNGIVTQFGSTTAGYNFSAEVSNFWVHLSLSGFDPQYQYSNAITGNFNSQTNVLNAPFAKIGEKASIGSFYPSASTYPAMQYMISNKQFVTDADRSVFPVLPTGIINTIKLYEALAVDQKIDDGNPAATATGNTRSYYYPSGGSGASVCSNVFPDCIMLISMLSQVGELPISR